MAPLPKKERPQEPVRKKVFTEYWMTGDAMYKIVVQKHEKCEKEQNKKTREKNCMQTALANFRKIERRNKAKKALPKRIKANPRL